MVWGSIQGEKRVTDIFKFHPSIFFHLSRVSSWWQRAKHGVLDKCLSLQKHILAPAGSSWVVPRPDGVCNFWLCTIPLPYLAPAPRCTNSFVGQDSNSPWESSALFSYTKNHGLNFGSSHFTLSEIMDTGLTYTQTKWLISLVSHVPTAPPTVRSEGHGHNPYDIFKSIEHM